jgi:hypothetical protein
MQLLMDKVNELVDKSAIGSFSFDAQNNGDPLVDADSNAVADMVHNGTITGWSIVGDDVEVGSVVVDLKKNGVSVVGDVSPTLSSAASASGVNMTNWTTSFVVGDKFTVSYSGFATLTKVHVIFTHTID